MADYLSGLTDVSISELSSKDFLLYSGGTFNKWENKPTIDITENVADGQYLYLSGNTISGNTYVSLSISTAISTEISDRVSGDASLTTAVSTEIVIRGSSDESLSTAVSTLSSGSTEGVESLSSALSTEIITRGSTDTVLSTTLSTEIITRGSTDTVLSTTISTDNSTSISRDNSISQVVSIESSVRALADSALSSSITNEASIRLSKDNSISTNVSNISGYTITLTSNDTSLSTAIVTEISDRVSGDDSITNIVSTNLSTLNSTDLVLSTSITGETTNRISSDSSLLTLISAISGQTDWSGGNIPLENLLLEGQALGLVEGALTGITFGEEVDWGEITGTLSAQTDLYTELSSLSTAIGAIPPFDPSGITASLSTEVLDRTSGDESLSTAISNVPNLSSSLSTEVSNRTSGDGSLSTSISTEGSTRLSVDTSLSTAIGNAGSSFFTINAITAATYTILSTDNGSVIECSNTCTVTLPDSLTTGFNFLVVSTGSSKTITLSATTTLYTKGSDVKIESQFGAVSVYHKGSNIWVAFGDLS